MWHPDMPPEVFKFKPRELNRWCDGQPHILRPDVDFPASMDVHEIKKRLVRAALKRDVDIVVWFLDGNVHFVMTPWLNYRGGN